MSMKAMVRSSSSIFVAGSSPATILQKMQSSAIAGGGYPRVHRDVSPPVLDELVAAQAPFERESRLLRHATAGGVVRVDVQLHAVPAAGDTPLRQELHGRRGDAAAAMLGRDPVADLGAAVVRIAAQQADR